MTHARLPRPWRLAAARGTAWALLLAGWAGIGSFAQVLAATQAGAFALVALWLLALGITATVATRDSLRASTRQAALLLAALATAAALLWAARGGGAAALLVVLLGWAALAALASGVVRSLRWALPLPPGPPIGAACAGALVAALVLGDLGDVPALALRLASFVAAAAALLAWLQPADGNRAKASRCRAGLFDCSLPAWPAGAWRDPRAWPTLLAGLAMLPTMAALPLMAALCRAQSIEPQAMVLLHFAAMFVPALALRQAVSIGPRALAAVCALSLAAAAAFAAWAAPPLDLFGVAIAQGSAWGLAWSGQLWSPERRGAAGASPLRASIGYAALTLAIGVVVDLAGIAGIDALNIALGALALAAWPGAALLRQRTIRQLS